MAQAIVRRGRCCTAITAARATAIATRNTIRRESVWPDALFVDTVTRVMSAGSLEYDITIGTCGRLNEGVACQLVEIEAFVPATEPLCPESFCAELSVRHPRHNVPRS